MTDEQTRAPVEIVGVDPLEGEGDGGPHESRLLEQRTVVNMPGDPGFPYSARDTDPSIPLDAMLDGGEKREGRRVLVERERAAGCADTMAAAAAKRLERGHDDDAAAQLDTATEIARAIREPGYGCPQSLRALRSASRIEPLGISSEEKAMRVKLTADDLDLILAQLSWPDGENVNPTMRELR